MIDQDFVIPCSLSPAEMGETRGEMYRPKYAKIREELRRKDQPNLSLVYHKKMDFTSICIACDVVLVGQPREEHPLFIASVCEPCYNDIREYGLCFQTEGATTFCSICTNCGGMLTCENLACRRAYCYGCVRDLVSEDLLYDVLNDDSPWLCFLCTPYTPETHFLLIPRPDRLRQLRRMYFPGRGDLDEPLASIRVLSLFDGISAGLVALKHLELQVEVYYASEVDQDAIRVAETQHPECHQLGDVCKLTAAKLKQLGPIDLLIGGSPCDELSIANPKRRGLYGTRRTRSSGRPKRRFSQGPPIRQSVESPRTHLFSSGPGLRYRGRGRGRPPSWNRTNGVRPSTLPINAARHSDSTFGRSGLAAGTSGRMDGKDGEIEYYRNTIRMISNRLDALVEPAKQSADSSIGWKANKALRCQAEEGPYSFNLRHHQGSPSGGSSDSDCIVVDQEERDSRLRSRQKHAEKERGRRRTYENPVTICISDEDDDNSASADDIYLPDILEQIAQRQTRPQTPTCAPSHGGSGTGKLFFEFYRIKMTLETMWPGTRLFYLYENVCSMPEEDRSTITRFFGVEPSFWDAADYSPMTRKRYFWGNLPSLKRPEENREKDRLWELSDVLMPNRIALVSNIPTVTTNRHSMRPRNMDPVQRAGRGTDNLWTPEVEKMFGFPTHYTDIANLNNTKRHALLGKSWSVPVIANILWPLRFFFKLEVPAYNKLVWSRL